MVTDLAVPLSVSDDGHLKLAAYWLTLCDGQGKPCYKSINPAKIPRLLPFIAYAGRNPDGEFHFRVWGSELVRMFNTDMTNRSIYAFQDQACAKHFERLFDLATSRDLPVYVSSKFCYPDRSFMVSEKTVFPLYDETGILERLLMYQSFDSSQASQDTLIGASIPTERFHQMQCYAAKGGEIQLIGEPIEG